MAATPDTFQALIDCSPDPMFAVDRDYCYTTFNRAHAQTMQALYGVQIETGGCLLDYMSVPADRQTARANLDRALAGETLVESAYSGEDSLSRAYFEVRHYPLYDPDNTVAGVGVLAANITGRVQTSAALRESEARFAAVFQTSHDAISIVRRSDGVCLDANPAFCAIFEVERQQVVGRRAAELGLWVSAEQRQAFMQRILAQDESPNMEAEFRTHSGKTGWMLASGNLACIAGEDCILIFGKDITARKRAEAALQSAYDSLELQVQLRTSELRLSEERLAEALAFNQAIIDAAPTGILIYKTTGACVSANPAAGHILGAGPEDLLRQDFTTNLRWRAYGLYEAAIQALETGQPVVKQFHGASSFGKEIWLSGVFSPLDIGGQPHLLYMFEDDTRRQQAEMALQELNVALEQRVVERTAEVQDLYDNAPIGYHSLDANGVFQRINQTELNWLGYSRDEIIGKMSFAQLVTPESRVTFQRNFPIFLRQGWISNLDFDIVRKDGSLLPVVVTATAIYDAQGNYLHSRSAVFDNTERKKAQQALRQSWDALAQANSALEKALRVKDEFLAAMNHELRTPLSGILGIAELLEATARDNLTEKQLTAVHRIQQSGWRLLELIDNVLTYTHLQSGKFLLNRRPSSLDEICRSSLRAVHSKAESKQQQLEYSLMPVALQVDVDPDCLQQAISLLLENAIKFTPAGGRIELAADALPEIGQVRIRVEDTGIGIEAEDLPRLFDPFVQLDASLARQYEGAGLGLPLVKGFVELHGGRIEVESVFGQGSAFTIILPLIPG